MFSSRFHWDFQPNRLTAALAAKRAAGVRILDLTSSNPTLAGFDYPPEIAGALCNPDVLSYQPEPAGMPAAREAVSAYYSARGQHAPVNRILLTASTSEAYSYLFKLLTNPGDEVLVPRPSYPLFEYLAVMESVKVRQYPLVYHGAWGIELQALEDAITTRARAVVVVNPNNPTGSYIKTAELHELVRLCREHGLALISDEVFSVYPLTEGPGRAATLSGVDECLTFVMNGLSKAAGLPQMKLGWIVVNGPAPQRHEAIEKLEWIADTYLSVSTPVQCAAAQLLQAGESVRQQITRRCLDNLAFARETLAGSSANLLHVEGGWCCTLQVPRVKSEEDWALDLLEHAGVLVQPGLFYDFEAEAFLVLSLLTEPIVFREALCRIRDEICQAAARPTRTDGAGT